MCPFNKMVGWQKNKKVGFSKFVTSRKHLVADTAGFTERIHKNTSSCITHKPYFITRCRFNTKLFEAENYLNIMMYNIS